MSSALDIALGLVMADGRTFAEAAVDVQLRDMRVVLEGDKPNAYLTRSRGYSKTQDMACAAVGMLLAGPPGGRLYWLAADQEQGELAIDSVALLVANTRSLQGALDVLARKVIATRSGSSLVILAADSASSWGIRPDAIFLDEFSAWPATANARRLWESVSSSAAKLPNCRLCIISSAGSPQSLAYKVLEGARSRPDAWYVSETPGPPPWIPADAIEEQRRRLPPSVFCQLWENVWSEDEGSFLSAEALDRCFTLDGPALAPVEGRRYFGAVDLGHSRDRSCFMVGHAEGSDVYVDRVWLWTPSKLRTVSFADVEETILAAHRRFRLSKTYGDPWQGIAMFERLEKAGLRVVPWAFSTASKQRLASALLEAVNDATVRLYDADGLRDELLALRLEQKPSGAWSFDHSSAGHDDMAVTLSLLLVACVENSRAGVVVTLGGGTRWAVQPGRDGRWVAVPVGAGAIVERGDLRLDEASAARRGFSYRDKPAPETPDAHWVR